MTKEKKHERGKRGEGAQAVQKQKDLRHQNEGLHQSLTDRGSGAAGDSNPSERSRNAKGSDGLRVGDSTDAHRDDGDILGEKRDALSTGGGKPVDVKSNSEFFQSVAEVIKKKKQLLARLKTEEERRRERLLRILNATPRRRMEKFLRRFEPKLRALTDLTLRVRSLEEVLRYAELWREKGDVAMAVKKKKSRTVKPKGPGGPRITKGSSSGDYSTPKKFISACEKRFGPLVFDLAASAANTRVPDRFWTVKDDSLKQDWAALSKKLKGLFWLNPPYADIGSWAAKCFASSSDAEILFLVPASVGAKWFRDNVFHKADVYFLYGRLTFEGQTTPYPKDCMLVHFHSNAKGSIEIWEWGKELVAEKAAA